jgi:hypothetical protein
MDAVFFIEIAINFNTAFTEVNKDIIDDRKAIAIKYLTGWFFIDILSILPLELILLAFIPKETETCAGSGGKINGMIRMTKFSKLYKLLKITRLTRLFKLMKNRNQFIMRIGILNKISHSFERLSFFVGTLFIIAHIFGCIWIFFGRNLGEEGWIFKNEYEDLTLP